MESILVAFRGLSAPSDRVSVLLDLLNELDSEERLHWQESANSFFHRDFGFLPPELFCQILDMLDAPTLLRCCQVSRRWLQRISAYQLAWFKLAKSLGAKLPHCEIGPDDTNFMRRLVAKSLGQRHSIKSGRAFKGRKILEENPNFTVADCCGNVLAAANVYDVNGGEGVVTLYDLDSDAEIMRLTQNPEFGFPCAVKLFSGMEFVCVAYTSGKLACYRLHDPDGSRRHDLYLTNLQPTPPGSIYCVGGCMNTKIFICGGSDCKAYIWDLTAKEHEQFLAIIPNPPDEAVVSANIGEGAIVTASKRSIRIYKYDEKSHIATAAQSPPWRKISLETGHRDVEPALAEAFFTPGVHYRDGAVTFVRQKPLFDTATIGNADIVTVDCASGHEVRTTHVNQKIRKLLAVGSRFALALLPFFDASYRNLIVIDLVEKKVVGGCTVPHSKSTTPDLSQIALGNVSWLDGLGEPGDPSLLVGLPVINQSHVLLVDVF